MPAGDTAGRGLRLLLHPKARFPLSPIALYRCGSGMALAPHRKSARQSVSSGMALPRFLHPALFEPVGAEGSNPGGSTDPLLRNLY